MQLKKLYLVGIFFLSILIFSFNTDTIDKIAKLLLKWSSDHPIEKVYLHFDKPYYAVGDTIWFKAYITTTDRYLFKLSGVLNVDLINEDDSLSSSIKLPIIAGTGRGDFILANSLTAGNYRIRAYTSWMRNAGEEYFFDRLIPVVDGRQVSKTPARKKNLIPALENKVDLQFFPEGGDLVNDISSLVAFKAVNANGNGVAVKGVILDNENRKIAEVITQHLGMGSFTILPEKGKQYRATILYANGVERTIALPNAKDKGIVLAINDDDEKELHIRITVNAAFFLQVQNTEINLVAQSGGIILYAANKKLEKPELTARIPKARFPSGIIQFTLFAQNSEPVNERLIFIQNPDHLNLIINTEKPTYKQGEQIKIDLLATNPANKPALGTFSVSVVNEDKVPYEEINERTIFSDLLLTSDLRGYIEKPNYYFTNISNRSRSNLNLLMLTQGYRRFEWKQLLADNLSAPNYKAEKGIEISGRVKSLLGKPIEEGNVSLISPNAGLFQQSQTDEKGRFSFQKLVFLDTTKVMIQAQTKKGNRNVVIEIDNNYPELKSTKPNGFQTDSNLKITMSAYAENSGIQYGEQRKDAIPLEEVKVTAKKIVQKHSSNLAGIGNADVVITSEILSRGGGTLSDRLLGSGKLGRSTPYFRQMQLIIDGVYRNPPFSMDDINPSDVSSVEILRNAGALGVYGVKAGLYGIIIINSKRGGEDRDDNTNNYVAGMVISKTRGYYPARQFYIPKYNGSYEDISDDDFRSTILWQPDLITDSDGRAMINSFKATAPGTYRVIIEGLDTEGNIGREVYRYKVEQ